MEGIFDSATDMIALQGADCTDCTGLKYDIKSRVESGLASIGTETVTKSYGSTELTGKMARD